MGGIYEKPQIAEYWSEIDAAIEIFLIFIFQPPFHSTRKDF